MAEPKLTSVPVSQTVIKTVTMQSLIESRSTNPEVCSRLLQIYNTFEDFKKYWFSKDARITNNRLIRFSTQFTSSLEVFCPKNPNDPKNATKIMSMYYMLSKISDNELKRIFKIPAKKDGNEELIKTLKLSRVNIIKAWNWLRNKFAYQKFQEQFAESWSKYDTIMRHEYAIF